MLSRENTNEQVENDLIDHRADVYEVPPTESITGAIVDHEDMSFENTGNSVCIEEEQSETGETILRAIIPSLVNSGITDVSHIICVWSYVSKYKRLVDEFINSDHTGNSILHLLVKDGNEEVIKLILEKIDSEKLSEVINAPDKTEDTPSDNAVIRDHLETFKPLIEANDGFSVVLHLAAVYNRLNIAQYLIEKGADVNLCDQYGMSPLDHAAAHGHSDVVKLLIKKGADVNHRNKYYIGPVHYAAMCGHLEIVKYFIEKGSNLSDGITPLH